MVGQFPLKLLLGLKFRVFKIALFEYGVFLAMSRYLGEIYLPQEIYNLG
ncbi:hypothetical protein PCC7424_2044 [Gloeothece citriformis PCC 7424]|uniref:Uncharacterized protein n=1 Tax=Gloeothece citriformis (strain PCC 7424) TaxID=65393 RepID=B7KF16_GLOC7|nr:hypothetical protein PCC7424_2044 [Gloeothece citriformis PCC 7424]